MFAQLIEKLHRREDLTEGEASAAMVEIMDGRATPAQIAGMLIALSMKGERPAEIVGFARTMRERRCVSHHPSTTCSIRAAPVVTGSTRSTCSSLSALTVAACGVPVASTAIGRCRVPVEARISSRLWRQRLCVTRRGRAVSRVCGHRVLLCSGLPPLDGAMRAPPVASSVYGRRSI